MKTSKYVDDNGVELEYILQKSSSPSKALIVAFPGPDGKMRGGEWGYLVSMKKVADVNALFLKTDPEYSKSRLTMRDGKPMIDEAIFSLVTKISNALGIEQIVSIGTSMGGYSSLYFGLKYNWDIISGSPPYTFLDRTENDILYSMGKAGETEREKMNNLLSSIVKSCGGKYSKKLFVSWGEGENYWKNDSEGVQMIRDFEKCNVKYMHALYPFSDHLTCAELFPQILEKYLKYYLGLSGKPVEDGSVILPPKVKMYRGLAEAYNHVLEAIESCVGIKGNLDIKNNVIYGFNDDDIALRNYVYVKEGWFWSAGNAYKWSGVNKVEKPVKFHKFWDMSNINRDETILSFYFQSTLLRWYKRQLNDSVLKWLLINFVEYVNSLPNISEASFNYVHQKPFDHVIRLLYFIELHKLSVGNIENSVEVTLSSEILQALRYTAEQGANPIPIRWQYRMVLGLLTVAVYYRESEAYEVIYSAALDIFNELNEYHFDKNGCCISGQMDSQDFLVGELKIIMDFIVANEMGKSKPFYKAKRIYNKVMDFAAHICQPNNRLPALGHTSVGQWCNSRNMVEHSAGNYIQRTSNICILEDSKSVSYITIHGGSNINSPNRHCDLLSFTWNYGGEQVFYDAGSVGRNDSLEEYVSSSVAHNGYLCDLMNYVTPDYSDWTAVEEDIDEREDCVLIPTAHTLIDGVILKRKFFWIKPNILMLIDEGIADRNREFTQNFLLGDFGIDKKDLSRVKIMVSKNIEGHIFQWYGDNNITMEEYRGVDEIGEKFNLRGTIIENWSRPRRGLNLAYTKKATEAKFITSIELHSKKQINEEQSLQSVNFDAEGKLIIVLVGGKIIYERT